MNGYIIICPWIKDKAKEMLFGFIGYVWFLENVKERKKIMWKMIFFSLGYIENMMEKKYK